MIIKSFRRLRNFRYWEFLAATGLALFLGGCATSARLAFDEIGTIVQDRAGKRVHWSQGAEEDAEVRAWVETELQKELTPASAVAISLLNNRKLQAIYQSLAIGRAQVVQATLLPNPVFSGNYKGSTNGGEDPEAEFVIAANILDILTLPFRRRMAQDQFEALKAEVAREVFALAAEVQAQFFAVQAGEQMLEMLGQVVEATEASVDASRRLYEAGNITDLELANEEAMHSRARLDLAAAELETRKTRERLHILMGLWGHQTNLQIPPRLPEMPDGERSEGSIEGAAVAANLELEAMRHRIDAAARGLGLTRATALIPELELGAAFTREADGNRLVGPDALFVIPIFDQGRPRVAAAAAALRREQEEYYYKAVEVRAAARAAKDHLDLARERALYSGEVELPLNVRIVEASQLQYNAMQIGVFQLLQAKRNQIEAGRRYIEDLLDYWLASTEVESILWGHVTEFGMETTALDSVVGSPLH